MENKAHALAAGLFVVLAAALLAGLALWLTRDSAQYREYELSTADGVSGLQPQAAVRYKGVAVGKVTHIGFDAQASGNVLIRIAVNEQAPVGAATYAVLGYQGVTGLAHVLLDDSGAPHAPLLPGTSGLPRLPLKPSAFGRLAEQAPNVLAQIDEATRRINQLLGDQHQQLLAQTLGQIGQAAGSVDRLGQRLDSTVEQIGRRLDPALAALPPLTQDARQTLRALEQAGGNLSALADDLGQTTRRLNAEGGAIDQIAGGSQALARAANQFNSSTLPRLNRAADATARAARQIGHTAGTVSDNPQLLIYGQGRAQPGPGEDGFAEQ